jgi:cytochrome c-type biogenesis protein CcmH
VPLAPIGFAQTSSGEVVQKPTAANPAAEAPLPDHKDEMRAQALMTEIRCVSCENEPISQSGSDIAVDMRILVREKIAMGLSDGEIRSWFAQRYGDFVLFRPPSEGLGMLLWLFPLGLLGVAVMTILAIRRQARAPQSVPVDET